MPLSILAALGIQVGQGIFSYLAGKKGQEKSAAQVKSLIDLMNAERIKSDEFIAGLGEVFGKLKEQTRKDIQRTFQAQAKETTRGLSQRRLLTTGFGETLKRKAMGRTQEAISKAMLGIETAQLQTEMQARQAAFQQARQMAELIPGIQKQLGAGDKFAEFLTGAFAPIFQWAEQQVAGGLIKEFEGWKTPKAPVEKALTPVSVA